MLIILLLAAWFFRWDQGPTQSVDGVKIIHNKDRWTGQTWMVKYGEIDGEFVSGQKEPFISKKEIATKQKKLLSSNNQYLTLNETVKKSKKIIREYNDKHNNFMLAINYFGADGEILEWTYTETRIENDQIVSTNAAKELEWEGYIGDWDRDKRYSQGTIPLLPGTETSFGSFLAKNITKELVQAENTYRQAFIDMAAARAERSELEEKTYQVAQKELIDNSYKTRKLVTIIWIITLISTSIIIIYFYGTKRKDN